MARSKSTTTLGKRRMDFKRLRQLIDKGFADLTETEREEQSELLDRLPIPRSWFKQPRRRVARKRQGGRKPTPLRIVITIDEALLKRIDAHAVARRMTRSECIVEGTRKLIARR